MKPFKKFMIKRTIPGAESMTAAQLNAAGCGSRTLNNDLGCKCIWINSFVVKDGTFCVYAAARKEDVECHARCLTPDGPFEIYEVAGTLDVTGAYLRNEDCEAEKASKEVETSTQVHRSGKEVEISTQAEATNPVGQ